MDHPLISTQEIRPSDQDLVNQVLEGHTNAFGEIIKRYQAKIFSMAIFFTKSVSAAEDLSQDIFISTYESLHRFDGTRSFTNWILKIATHHCYNSARRKPLPPGAFESNNYFVSPEEELINKEQREKIFQALTHLEEDYKMVVWLFYFLERSYAQIADILEIPLHLVKIRLFRGKRAIGQVLLQDPGFASDGFLEKQEKGKNL